MAYSLLSIGIDDFEDHQEYATSFSLHTQLIVITLVQVQFLRNNPNVQLMYTNGDRIDEHGNYLWPFLSEEHSESGGPEQLLLDCYVAPSSVLFRRQLWENLNGFDGSLKTSDHDFFVRAAETYDLGYVADRLWAYRIHTGQVSRNLRTRYDAFKVLEKAWRRRPYPFTLYRRRRAVCHYNLAEALLWNRRYFRGVFHLIAAGIFDPNRGALELWRRLCRKL